VANDRLLLTIQDDGSGFELSGVNHSGMGIRIMRYRARVIGATLDLKRRPGQGTTPVCFIAAPQETRQETEGAQKAGR